MTEPEHPGIGYVVMKLVDPSDAASAGIPQNFMSFKITRRLASGAAKGARERKAALKRSHDKRRVHVTCIWPS